MTIFHRKPHGISSQFVWNYTRQTTCFVTYRFRVRVRIKVRIEVRIKVKGSFNVLMLYLSPIIMLQVNSEYLMTIRSDSTVAQ